MSLPSFDASLRILALLAVRDKKDWDAAYRRVCRWYSTTFHTPLHQVFDLDESFVLQHYYEHTFGELEDADWRREAQEAIETPEERQARLAREAIEDAELLRKAAADRHRLEERQKKAPISMSKVVDDVKREFEDAADKLQKALGDLPTHIAPAKKVGERVKAAKADQVNMPGFAEDAFVRLSEDPLPDDDTPMGLNMPPAPPKRRK
jgi:glucan phosphorylase